MALVQLKDVSVAYHKQDILKNFNLDIEKGKLISLLGPSGCGKTTTLRLIAGFLEARSGQFLFKETDYTKVPVNRRNFGFVFQNYALFPHLSVFDNVAFGLRLRKLSKKEIEKRVASMLEIVNLSGFEKRFTQELSGGQRQRVAIARALIIEPDLLLFDEPLSNLDANLRVSMRVEIRRIQQELGITTVYVSHDQEECFSISDQVAVMNQGIIEQLDEPSIIYKQPKTTFVADFIGFKNFITFDERENLENTVRLQVKGVDFFVNRRDDQSASAKIAAIRPDNIKAEVVTGNVKNQRNILKGTVTVCTFLGRGYQFIVETAIGPFTVNQETEAPFEVGQHLKLIFPEDKLVLVE
ncbi:ABC transporter ATP-binding protein [Salipaludibacillus agaradhaerens]|uniref:Carnitine transport ATP-binding protein OpuCA n=1 Tax=Salipaludibacillus agaradhaerens TaxID=76935 RepID=A0A9Q4FZM1_SALAG|nr:ABC transporter ATP-binding protein [Salipaludibacillus agaradhaerens]MCR6097247.1 ABC transporter ATP-binding protein [Salipaludibacillus agaradhaerens]MCR6105931.1 ABC transporter ATP-binding protein [Salipaludibacillus agaradhaerens]MCR6113268.1 ABC transporter ATP-binding protein [Salipaludibacillus agaradhaerens]MCR6117964.1 ABC transporter ATP-binding protein [Salipaludibacillus agaradhaerens]